MMKITSVNFEVETPTICKACGTALNAEFVKGKVYVDRHDCKPATRVSLGLDVHGVIDADPDLFSKLSQDFTSHGHEIHIITGQKDTPQLHENIKKLGIVYTHFFSITSYHESIGTPIKYDEKGHPWMDNEIWNRSKGEYCKRMGITLHIDDSPLYGQYFSGTIYLLYKKGVN
jgi:hypothetical protein